MRTYKSDVGKAIHEMAAGLHRAGVIDEERMERFEDTWLLPSLTADDIRALRERESLSREDLARELYVSPELVGRWERGKSRPSPQASKLLDLARRKGIEAIR